MQMCGSLLSAGTVCRCLLSAAPIMHTPICLLPCPPPPQAELSSLTPLSPGSLPCALAPASPCPQAELSSMRRQLQQHKGAREAAEERAAAAMAHMHVRGRGGMVVGVEGSAVMS